MSGMVEFRITSDLQEIRKQAITTNYPEVKAWVDGVAEQYRSIVVTEDGVQAAKQDRANLRKLQANIDQVRKECRAAALAVSAETEANCKELVATLETAVQNLDTQAKAFEARRKEEKKNRLSAYFAQVVDDMAEWLTFDDCFNPKWLNATYADSTAQMDVCAAIDRCRADLNAIRALHSEFETTLLDYYRETHDVTAVLQKNARLLEMKKAQEEREKAAREAAEAKRLAEEAAQKALVVEEPAPQEVPSVADVIRSVEQEALAYAAVEEEPQEETIYTVDFRAHGTAAQLNGLRHYMKNNGIRFERVPE